MKPKREVNYWWWVAPRVAIGIIFLILLLVFNVFDFVCDSSTQRLGSGELDPAAIVIVTLDDNTCHLPDCPEIKGTTEKMKYGIAAGKGIIPCSVCIRE